MAQEDMAGRRAREEAVYRHHAPQVFAYLLRHMTSHQDAEDLLVEVFLVVLEKPQILEIDERRLAAYIQTVARNKMVDYYRKRGRRQILPLEPLAETLYESEELAPEQQALAGEEFADLRQAFATLPTLQQTILRLRFVHGLRCGEIAARLAKSENSVRVMLTRSLKLLRKQHSLREERSKA